MSSRVLTVPNQLTFITSWDFCRSLLSRFITAAIRHCAQRHYHHCCTADALDGVLARRLNQKTALGAYLDPIADKLLLSSSYVVLALNRKISWWLATLVLSRDIITSPLSARS